MELNSDDFRTRRDPSLVDALLDVAFPEGLSPSLDALLDRELAAAHLRDFNVGVVAPMAADRPVRLAVASVGEGADFDERVRDEWPSAALASFLATADPRCRRMVDASTPDDAVLYLDDLQDAMHGLRSPVGDDLISATLHLTTGERTVISRHGSPPLDVVSGPWRARLEALLALGAAGLWGVRWAEDSVVGILLVTEKATLKGIQAVEGVVEGLGGHPLLEALAEVVGPDGFAPYPDALEIVSDGTDLTLGFRER